MGSPPGTSCVPAKIKKRGMVSYVYVCVDERKKNKTKK